jgi:hypothetical protein
MNRKHLMNGWTVTLFLTVQLAFAANQQSWVSSTGSDANDCTRAHPCATFQGALSKTAALGTISVADPGDYGPVDIDHGVTIDGGGMGRINASAGVAINVRPGTTTIENLAIDCGGGIEGIRTFQSVTLVVEKVTISNCQDGIDISANTMVFIRDSLIHDGVNGVSSLSVTDIKDTTLVNLTSTGIFAGNGGTMTVDNCFVSSAGTGISAGAGGAIVLSNSTITKNTLGLAAVSGGTITSFVNNRIINNGTDGAPTKSVFQK